MLNNKIKIAVSSCLLGEAVRYDGTDKHIEYITQHLAAEYNLISLYPEIAVGMGVPRAPLHLVDEGHRIQVLGVDNPACNMTTQLSEYGKDVTEKQPDICGYIFKKNSPSCGTKNVKVVNAQGQYEKRGQGIYVSEILTILPMLPVIDEEDCVNKKMMDAFLLNVARYSEYLKQRDAFN